MTAIKIAVVMGSISDWSQMKHCCDLLEELDIPYQKQILSAHRMPDEMFTFAKEAHGNGIRIIIAGAGGAAHLPGMIASQTTLPVIGVPMKSRALSGMDSLLSIVQMPAGIPVATMAIGESGAKNAALMAVRMLAAENKQLTEKLARYQAAQKQKAIESEAAWYE